MKKLLAGVLLSASVLGVCVLGGTAFAADIDDTDTDVGIGFTGHHPGPNPGSLEISWAPDSFDFGSSNTVNTTAATFTEKSGVAKKYVVIKDERGNPVGTEEWKVTAKLSSLTTAAVGGDQLTGAELTFDAVKQGYSGTGNPESGGAIIAPTGSATVKGASFTLQQGATAIDVMEDGASGTGTYQGYSAMEMTDIELSVPGNVAKSGKQYSGTVTWTLADAI